MLRHAAAMLMTAVGMYVSIAAAQKRIDIPSLPSCGAKQNLRWETLQSDLAGVDIRDDPKASSVGRYSSGRFGLAGLYLFPYNWLPLSEKRQVMCGRFERFDWNSHSNEQDWNLRIIPSKLFSGMFADAKQYVSNPDDVWTCDPTPKEDRDRHQCEPNTGKEEADTGKKYEGALHNCFEAEVTPRKDRFESKWFHPAPNACSKIVDYDLCVYGPYVTEAVHGNRPEIHPLEAMWWRNVQDAKPGSPAAQDWTLLHVQDASNRYHDLSDFFPRPPGDWAPWAGSGLVADFQIAVEVPSEPAVPLLFNVDEFYADGVVPPGSAERTYIASYEGKDILQVTERQPSTDHHYQVGFEGLCTTPDANVRMFLSLTSAFGIRKEGGQKTEAGFHAIRVSNEHLANSVPLAVPPPTGVALLGVVPSSIHALNVDGRVQLMGQMGTAHEELGSTLLEQPPPQSKPISVESLLPFGEKTVFLQRVLSARQSSEPSSSAGKLLAGYLGISSVPEALVERVPDAEFTASPQFAYTREGKPAWEDSEELFGDFNAKLAKAGRAGQVELLGNTNLHSEWTFEGWTCGDHPEKGCENRHKLQVLMGRPPVPQPDFIYVDADQDVHIPQFHVYFPQGVYKDTLLLLVATGSVQDPDSGQVKTTTIQFYNITIPVKDDSEAEAERIVASIATLIPVPSSCKSVSEPLRESCIREKLSSVKPDPNLVTPFAQEPRYRQAEMLRLNIRHAAEGKVIQPDTLRVLMRAAQRLAELP